MQYIWGVVFGISKNLTYDLISHRGVLSLSIRELFNYLVHNMFENKIKNFSKIRDLHCDACTFKLLFIPWAWVSPFERSCAPIPFLFFLPSAN